MKNKTIVNILIGVLTNLINILPVFILRSILIKFLGSDIVGLQSLFTNLLSYLMLLEMGLGTAIQFSLYKPFANNDYKSVAALLNSYKKLSRILSVTILGLGIIISYFITGFVEIDLPANMLQFYFILFIFDSSLTFISSYPHVILRVDEKNYILSIKASFIKLVVSTIQILIISVTSSFILYLISQIIVNLCINAITSIYIKKKYYRYFDNQSLLSKHEFMLLFSNMKSLMFHRIGGILVLGTDNLVISFFCGLSAVTRINNYNLIINAFNMVIGTLSSVFSPKIGRELNSMSIKENYQNYRQVDFVNNLFVVLSLIILSRAITPFVSLWLGNKQTIDQLTLLALILNLYFSTNRWPVETYNIASGNVHQDKYASIVEGIINLVSSIVLVKMIGLPGVLIGTLISNVCIIFWIKPLIAYKFIFKENVRQYYITYFKQLFVFIFIYFISHLVKIEGTFFSLVLSSIKIAFLTISLLLAFNYKNIYFKNIYYAIRKKYIKKSQNKYS